MILEFTPHFKRSYRKSPIPIQRALHKQSMLLLEDIMHPSLRAKKYDEARDLWQARVNDDWRFYFRIVDNVYLVEEIKRHPK